MQLGRSVAIDLDPPTRRKRGSSKHNARKESKLQGLLYHTELGFHRTFVVRLTVERNARFGYRSRTLDRHTDRVFLAFYVRFVRQRVNMEYLKVLMCLTKLLPSHQVKSFFHNSLHKHCYLRLHLWWPMISKSHLCQSFSQTQNGLRGCNLIYFLSKIIQATNINYFFYETPFGYSWRTLCKTSTTGKISSLSWTNIFLAFRTVVVPSKPVSFKALLHPNLLNRKFDNVLLAPLNSCPNSFVKVHKSGFEYRVTPCDFARNAQVFRDENGHGEGIAYRKEPPDKCLG